MRSTTAEVQSLAHVYKQDDMADDSKANGLLYESNEYVGRVQAVSPKSGCSDHQDHGKADCRKVLESKRQFLNTHTKALA